MTQENDIPMTNNIIIPSSPKDREEIKNAMSEISNSMTRMEAERDLITDILKKVEEEHEIPKKYMRKMSKIFHKQNFVEMQQEQEDIEALYETVSS
jgi:polyhydroxyalkanoate synthesis regulator phasin